MHVWDATDYRANSRAQLALAQEFLTRIAIPADARVLDVGCGDGKVTALIRAAVGDRLRPLAGDGRAGRPGASGVHASSWPTCASCRSTAEFDVAVSFTALHWVVDGHVEALAAIRRALVPGGRFHAQFPGAGNMAELTAAADEVSARPAWRESFAGFRFPWLMPSLEVYRPLVEAVGARDRAARARSRATSSTRGTPVWRAGCGRRGCRTPTASRRTAGRRGSTRSSVVYAERMPPDADGRLHVPSFRLELEAVRPF